MGGGFATWVERVEKTCANAVERTFALAFPTPIAPVHIARKLVAAFESGAGATGRNGRRFHVRLHPVDRARLAADLGYLEAQWQTMLTRLNERGGTPQPAPQIVVEEDRAIARGTVAIAVTARDEAVRLRLRIRGAPDAGVRLAGTIVVGRDPSCDLVLGDPRVSRRHLSIDEALQFRDLGSVNGTRLNGAAVSAGVLREGDVLVLGASELIVEGIA